MGETILVFRGAFQQRGMDKEWTLMGASGITDRVCEHLESFSFPGLWLSYQSDRPDNVVTLEVAACEGQQWVSRGTTKMNEQFRTIISDRIRTLPALRKLTLSKISIRYTEIETTHTSN